MNLKKIGLTALLSAAVGLAGVAYTTPASAHTHAAAPKPYGCDIDPNQKKCETGVGGTRVTGGTIGQPGGTTGGTGVTGGTTGQTGGTGATGGTTGQTGGQTGGTRATGGTNGQTGGTHGGSSGAGSGTNGAPGKPGTGAHVGGVGANGAPARGAGANGSSPIPGQSLPATGFGGTTQELGASPRAAAAGTQPVVIGLTSAPRSQRVTALPATGGGVPSQPASPLLAFIACGLAVLGLGLRKLAHRF